MAGRLSDDDRSVGQEADFVDASADTEVDVHLPLEVDWRSEPLQKDIKTSPGEAGVTDEGAVNINQQEQYRSEPPNGPDINGPDTSCHCRTFSGLGG